MYLSIPKQFEKIRPQKIGINVCYVSECLTKAYILHNICYDKLLFMKNIILILAAAFLLCITTAVESKAQTTSLANFRAQQRGNAIQLSWTALYENSMTSHEIQKSANGSSFTNIGTLVAQNNAAPFRYTFLDATPTEGNNYYRLRTIDKQGNESLSNILSVNNGVGKTDVRVLPNPAQTGVLNLQLSNISNGKYAISLYSNAGQKVFARSLNLSNGSTSETINLPRNIGHGLYVLQVTDGEMRINKQLIL